MNKLFSFLLICYAPACFSQSDSLSKETFVNEIESKLIDSSFSPGNFSKYYLLTSANPCSFKKFNYEELLKYSLIKVVPIYALNELAKNSVSDTSKEIWFQQNLSNAICLTKIKADSIAYAQRNIYITGKKEKKQALSQLEKDLDEKKIFDKSYFVFSKPVFTDDYQYAVMDVSFRCGSECDCGWTYLFERARQNWEIAGKILIWESEKSSDISTMKMSKVK